MMSHDEQMPTTIIIHKALQYTVYILMYISPLIGTSTTVHRVIHCIEWVCIVESNL